MTASDDKTARIWSLPDLRLLGVLRPPIGAGGDGKLYAVAISPDGRFAAVGGLTGKAGEHKNVYVFDIATKQIVQTLSDLSNSITSLAFGMDGRLAVGLGANGISVWREGTLVFQDMKYADGVYGLTFAPDGRLAVSSHDGKLRLYDTAGKLVAQQDTQAGKRPHRIAFSPDGTTLAVGFADALAVELRDGHTLAPRKRPDTNGLAGTQLSKVRWSANGQTLYAAGAALEGNDRRIIAWSAGGVGPRRIALTGFTDTNAAITTLPDGGICGADMVGGLRVADSTGALIAAQRAAGADMGVNAARSGSSRGLLLSYDGTSVEWTTLAATSRRLRFTALRPRVSVDSPAAELTDWRETEHGNTVSEWMDRSDPKLNGKPVTLGQSEKARGVSVVSSRLLVGTDWSLHLFSADGSEIWKHPIPGAAWRVNQSGDGRLVVAALADSTIRWYRADTGEELLALYVTEDATRWIAFTPVGYYTASAGGEDMIGWHMNRSEGQSSDFFPASRMRDRFYRPDVVKRVLSTLNEAEALRQADADRGEQSAPTAPVASDLPPVISISSPADNTQITGIDAAINYSVRSPSGKPIQAITILMNGRPLGLRAPDVRRAEPLDQATATVSVPIPAGEAVEVSLLAETDTRVSEPARVQLRGARAIEASAAVVKRKPNLYALLVGAADYRDSELRLRYSAKDAQDLAGVLTAQKGKLFGDVQVKLLTGPGDGREKVLDGLDWLRQSTTSSDMAMLFIAGHGANDGSGHFYFLPVDTDKGRLRATALSQSDIINGLHDVRGRVLAFLDTCHSGSVTDKSFRSIDMDRVVNEFSSAENGVIVMASSTGDELSAETDSLKNGVFAYAVIEGLSGAADANHDGVVTLAELNFYVIGRVEQLTHDQQHPNQAASRRDFPVASVR